MADTNCESMRGFHGVREEASSWGKLRVDMNLVRLFHSRSPSQFNKIVDEIRNCGSVENETRCPQRI